MSHNRQVENKTTFLLNLSTQEMRVCPIPPGPSHISEGTKLGKISPPAVHLRCRLDRLHFGSRFTRRGRCVHIYHNDPKSSSISRSVLVTDAPCFNIPLLRKRDLHKNATHPPIHIPADLTCQFIADCVGQAYQRPLSIRHSSAWGEKHVKHREPSQEISRE